MGLPKDTHMQQHQAERIARQIEDFWTKQGFDVRAEAVSEADAIHGREGSPDEWTVRTVPPLIGGVPRGATNKHAKTILRAFDRNHSDWRKFDDEPAAD